MTCSFSEFQNVCINKSEHESKSRQRRCDMSILVGMLRVMAENQLPQTVPLSSTSVLLFINICFFAYELQWELCGL